VAQDYTYAVSRLRSLEAAMPDKAYFQRLARTGEEALLAALREPYPAFEAVERIAEFERGLEGEKLALLTLVSSLVTDRRANELFRAGYDFDNLVHLWKAQRLGAAPATVPFGLVDAELVAGAVRGGGSGELPPYLAGLAEKLRSLGDGAELAEIEYEGETAKWRYLLEAAPGEFARLYVRARIDLANVKSAVRMRRTRLRRSAPERAWLAGGEIEPVRWRALAGEPEDEMLRFLGVTSYRGLLRLGLESEMPLWLVEPVLRAQLFECIGQSRYRFFDIAPVIYHLELHERNEELVRAVVVGVMNDLPGDMVLERVDALWPS
jgi:vacuolar-type H+-ATPase subunit C/Vma6